MSNLKENYHHGDLRDSLINATLELIRVNGPEKFSMADACKEAGVSKAAPYRHFSNREALLEAVIEHGFDQMTIAMQRASKDLTPGSNERIIALGLTYVNFAIAEPELFRLMFGEKLKPLNECNEPMGRGTFQLLLDEIIVRTRLSEIDKLMEVAFPLWTLVHGAATLTIDNSYEMIYPGSDTEAMIISTTETLLSVYPCHC